jgi:hypothetical protein
MSIVVPFLSPRAMLDMAMGPEALIKGVAQQRRHPEDLRWFKENAELLRLLAFARHPVNVEVLEICYRPALDGLAARIGFFPQYYRFFLHFALDLQALGVQGPDPAELARIALRSGLPQTELSDLQRLETLWLLRRAGVNPGPNYDGVEERLRKALESPRAFALPNRKIAYEVTHLAYYLTDFGRNPHLAPDGMVAALRHVGMLAWLEQNLDLLAETVLALQSVSAAVPALWQDRIASALPAFRFRPHDPGMPVDGYHAFLMCVWSQLSRRPGSLVRPFPTGDFTITSPEVETGTLRAMSVAVMAMPVSQRRSWDQASTSLLSNLEPEHCAILQGIASELPEFDCFFEAFARADLQDCVA